MYKPSMNGWNPPLLVTSFIPNLKRGHVKQGKYMTFIFVINIIYLSGHFLMGKLEFSKNSVNPVSEDYTTKS